MDMTTNQKETGAPPEDGEEIISHLELKECVDEFISATADARALSERCRDYYDGKQWTEAQIKELKRRKQAPIVNNRIKVKQNGLLGLTALRKGDPKAYPRNQADSGASEAATDGLRYAADRTNLNSTFLACADPFFCEGYTAANIVTETMPNGDVEVVVERIAWDRIFYDVYSNEHDFSDSRSKGFMMWMDKEDILEAFADNDPSSIEDALNGEFALDETFQDRPSWYQKQGKRHRYLVATHYYKKKGTWFMCIYTGGGFLLKPMESPWLDEYGSPECPIEMEHAYIDRDGNRYGEIASFLDLQDEINHRRSKALFLLSQRQTFGNRGAIQDIKKAKSELAKPDGHLEVQNGELNKDFGILPTGDMAQGQFELLQEAKMEMDAQSYNAQNAGDRQDGALSGVAIGKLQSAGMIELNKLFENFNSFKLRVYRQMWNRIRQSWTEEKWVRVTDDQDALRWIGFNVPQTMQEFLQETMDDESKPRAMRLGASAQMIMLEQSNPEALQEVVMTKNRPAELDMDIILDESYDSINPSQEQLDAVLQYGAQGQFDIVDLLEISNIRGKDKLIEKIETRRKEAAEAAEQSGPDPQSQYFSAKAKEAEAAAQVKQQDAAQTAIENQMLQNTGQVPFKGTVSA